VGDRFEKKKVQTSQVGFAKALVDAAQEAHGNSRIVFHRAGEKPRLSCTSKNNLNFYLTMGFIG
jgi:hypothetical protein